MKALIKTSQIQAGFLKINRQRVIYYQKASEKIRGLNLKTFFSNKLVEGRKYESTQIREITNPNTDAASNATASKFYRFRLKVKTIIFNAYDLDK